MSTGNYWYVSGNHSPARRCRCTCILIYTVEQRMFPGGSNDERLTDVGTRNCYIPKYSNHYLVSREDLLPAFTYTLELYNILTCVYNSSPIAGTGQFKFTSSPSSANT